jgi:murein DD-endopeptidase MepM/ murein hydrolase activator NlpD
MQILITDSKLVRTRVLQLRPWQLLAGMLAAAVLLMALASAIYHMVFVKAAREGWPLVAPLVKLVVRDEIAQRDRFLRENLDAIARKVGDVQAKLLKLEAMGERVTGMAGVKPDELKPLERSKLGARGGPFVPVPGHPTLEQLDAAVAELDRRADRHGDVLTLAESRLLESRLVALMVPSSPPVLGPVGSGFGFRTDPFSGQPALHTGLDFPAEPGTPILAAAGGVVVHTDTHPAYGLQVELDHGNGLATRYAHASRVLVKPGDLVRRGQKVAEVGTSGRSTGPHLHFEVLVQGVPQDPARFLAAAAPLRAPPR